MQSTRKQQVLDETIEKLVDSLSFSGEAKFTLIMTGEATYAKFLFVKKNREAKEDKNGTEFCGFSVHDIQTSEENGKTSRQVQSSG